MGIILIGYDIEKSFEPEITSRFINLVLEAQKELQVKSTFFILGRCVEIATKDLLRLKDQPFFELQQHTYSHIGVKTLWQIKPDGTTRFEKGESPQVIEEEIAKTNKLFKDRLGLDCRGIAIPRGFFRGLGDRPDLLDIFWRQGIRYMRAFSRNEYDWQPVSLDVQPFFYDIQGYPDILEIPVQGWQDCLWYEENGKNNQTGYLNYLKSTVDLVQKNNLAWSFVQHDWSTVQYDPDFLITRQFILYAQQKGVNFMTHREYYNMRAGKKAL